MAEFVSDEQRRQPKLGERVAQRILDEICESEMSQGDMLPSEPRSVAAYGVGRAAFREALRILEVHGAIEVRPGPGGGPMVKEPTAADLASALRLHLQLRGAVYEDVVVGRLAIEPFLARLAAQNRQPVGIRMLKELLPQLDTVDLNSRDDFLHLDTRFRVALGAASGNQLVYMLTMVMIEVYDSRIRSGMPMPPDNLAVSIKNYKAIIAAVLAGDANGAERYFSNLLELTLKYISRTFPDTVNERVSWH